MLVTSGTLAVLFLLQTHARDEPDPPRSLDELHLANEEVPHDLEESEERHDPMPRRRGRRRRNPIYGKIYGTHISNYAAEERSKMQVKIGLKRKAEQLAALGNRCEVCWILKSHCICSKIQPIDLPLDFIVVMHHKVSIFLQSDNEKGLTLF